MWGIIIHIRSNFMKWITRAHQLLIEAKIMPKRFLLKDIKLWIFYPSSFGIVMYDTFQELDMMDASFTRIVATLE